MGLFSSGVGKRSRRAAQAMSLNSDQAYMKTEDLLTKGTRDARKTLSGAYTAGTGYLSDAFKGSRGYLEGGQTASNQFLTQGFGDALARSDAGFDQSRNDLIGGRDAALGTTQSGYAEALQALQARYGQAGTQLQGAVDSFDPLLQRGMAGLDQYSELINGSLGVGGPEARQAAVDAFQAGPGYQWQVDQANQAAQRAANRVGSSSGGNTMDAVARLSSNLANQEYGSWQDRLVEQQTGYRGQAQNATAGRAAALTNLGGLYQQQAGQESGLITDRTNAMAGIHQTSGQNLAANSVAQGTAAAGIHTDQGKTMATNATNYANALAGLRTQYGQDRTNLRTSYGTAVAGLQTGLAGARAENVNKLYDSYNQHLGIALQGGNAQGQETASWGKGLLSLGSSILGMGTGGGGTIGGSIFSSLFK
jgi:hypothetical protein